MGLRKLSSRHYAVMRSLLLGDSPQEISLELGITTEYISQLQSDPMFRGELMILRNKANSRAVANASEQTPTTILKGAATRSAEVCVAAVDGVIDGSQVPLPQRLISARDILDRTGFSGVQKTAVIDVAQMISDAYRRRKEETIDPSLPNLNSISG